MENKNNFWSITERDHWSIEKDSFTTVFIRKETDFDIILEFVKSCEDEINEYLLADKSFIKAIAMRMVADAYRLVGNNKEKIELKIYDNSYKIKNLIDYFNARTGNSNYKNSKNEYTIKDKIMSDNEYSKFYTKSGELMMSLINSLPDFNIIEFIENNIKDEGDFNKDGPEELETEPTESVEPAETLMGNVISW